MRKLYNRRFLVIQIGIVMLCIITQHRVFGAKAEATGTMRATYNTWPTPPSNTVDVNDVLITPLPAPVGVYTDVVSSLVNKIEFGYDIHYKQYFGVGKQSRVTLEIKKYNVSNVLIGTVTQTLQINYDPFNTNPDKSKEVFVLTGIGTNPSNGGHKLEVKVTNIEEFNGSIWVAVTQLQANMYIDVNLEVERIYEYLGASTSITATNFKNLQGDGQTDQDEIKVIWPTVTGAEEYQLEWTYVNDYNTTLAGAPISPTLLTYDFKNNSTRIVTKATSYQIPNLFDRGWVLFRVRAVGKKMTAPYEEVFGTWSVAETGTVASFNSAQPNGSKQITTANIHEHNKNWQVTSTFAEEGKKKEVISYFDGSLRNRQTVTRVNTDSNVVVGETIYDYQGRPAVTILPTPVDQVNSTLPPLEFYEGFNKYNATTNYRAEHFDEDGGVPCQTSVSPLITTDGSSKYYSGNNSILANSAIDNTAKSFVPNANGYPFTQIEYTPDNTGRIRSQGGVGQEFQLGSGKETKYYYGSPNQEQLDRLFGSEVGDAAHYKKNVVIDPNGQVSVSYLDQEGRVVATALASDAPNNVTAIPNQTSIQLTNVDLLKKDANGLSSINVVNLSNDGIVYSSQFLVSHAGNYTFNYGLTVGSLDDPCLANNICFNCVYDLEIQVLNDCGVNLATQNNAPVNKMVGSFTVGQGNEIIFSTVCGTPQAIANAAYGQTIALGLGNYTINKILTINQAGLDFVVSQWLDSTKNTCIQSLWDYQQQYLNAIDYSSCAIDCQECLTGLGSKEDFIAQGKGTAAEYELQVELCNEMCEKAPSACDIAYTQMLQDMSPGGQYGEYTDPQTGAINASNFPVSIYNTSNKLPRNVANYGTPSGFQGTSDWKKPYKETISGALTDYYNEDGTIAKIPLTALGNGQYAPATSTAQLDPASNTYYSLPKHLTHLADFISYWNPSWAEYLVFYHPEYTYYKECVKYGQKQGTDPISSDEFDAKLLTTENFADAITNGFINGSTNKVRPLTTVGAYTYDPFATNSTFYQSSAMSTKFGNYGTIGSTSYSMEEYAAIITRGGTGSSGLFGTGGVTAILNKEWQTFKALYASEKTKIKQSIADNLARGYTTVPGLNDCIGNLDDYSPGLSGMYDFSPGNFLSQSLYFRSGQPCGLVWQQYYAGKVSRFPDQMVLPETNLSPSDLANVGAYQSYLQTGLCPRATALEAVINEVAENDGLDAASLSITNYASYSGYCLQDNNFIAPLSACPSRNWQATAAGPDVLNINWVDGSSNVVLTLQLNKAGQSIANWDDITEITGIDITTGNNFTVNAKVGLIYKTLTCTTSVNISTCNFPEVCQSNHIAKNLRDIMSALAANNELAGTSISLNNGGTYDGIMSQSVKNIFNSSNPDFRWTWNSGTQTFRLADNNATPAKRIELTVVGGTVSNTIKYFMNLESLGNNVIKMDGMDGSGNLLSTLTLHVKYVQNTTVSAVELGSCQLPTPAQCTGVNYQLVQDLYAVLKDRLLLNTPSTINLFNSPYMTPLLQTNLSGTQQLVSFVKDLVGPVYADVLTINFNTQDFCPLKLSLNSNSNIHLDQLVSINGIEPHGVLNPNGSYYSFKIAATFTLGAGTVNDYIYGESCIPLNFCVPCSDGNSTPITPSFSTSTPEMCRDARNAYVAAVNAFNAAAASLGLNTVQAPLATNWFGPNGYCNCVEAYTHLLTAAMSGAYTQAQLTAMKYANLNEYCSSNLELPCQPAANPIDPTVVFPTITLTNPCEEQLEQTALLNAQNAYNQYVGAEIAYITNLYKQHCLGTAVESFTSNFIDKEYHFTLYYYDQAGNLIKTVPPAGVEPLDLSATFGTTAFTVGQIIKQDRANNTKRVFTAHRLKTAYEYNSLNQLVSQNMPDHDPMTLFETTLAAGIDVNLIITKIQYITTTKGFLVGYLSGSNRGVMYTTNDAGASWTKVNDIMGVKINKVFFPTDLVGYAACDDGILLRTLNGGSSWDHINLYGFNVREHINDLYFINANEGILTIDRNQLIKVTNGSTSPTFATITLASSAHTSAGYAYVTGIDYTKNSSTILYVISARYKHDANTPEEGRIYTLTTAGTTATLVTSMRSNVMRDAYTIPGSPLIFATAGDAGTLSRLDLNTGTGLPINRDVLTNITERIIDLYYLNANEGIAIIEAANGAGPIYKTSNAGGQWQLLSNATDRFRDLHFFQQVGSTHKVLAVGELGSIAQVMLQAGQPFGLINLPNPTNNTLNTCYGFVQGGVPGAIVAGMNQTFLFSSNINAVSPTWTSITLTGIAAADQVAAKITANNYSGVLSGAFISTTGRLISFAKSATHAFSFTNITPVTPATIFRDIEPTTQDYLLVFNQLTVTPNIYRVNLSSSATPPASATLLTQTGTFTGVTHNGFTVNGTTVVLVGNDGEVFSGVLNNLTTPTSITWTSRSLLFRPVGFTDVAYNAVNNRVYATTVNGDIFTNTTSIYTSFTKITLKLAEELNAIKTELSNDAVLAGGENGNLYRINIIQPPGLNNNNYTGTLVSVSAGNGTAVNDVFLDNNTAYAVTHSGAILMNANYPFGAFSPLNTTANGALMGITKRNTVNEYVAVGSNAHVYKIAGNNAIKVNAIYPGRLNCVHFINSMEGAIVGNGLTARRTVDGGQTWQVVLPNKTTPTWEWGNFTSANLPNFLAVQVATAGTTFMAGTQGTIYRAVGNVSTSVNKTAFATFSPSSFLATTTINDIDFNKTGTHGYAVGLNTTNRRLFFTTNTGSTWTQNTSGSLTGTGKLNGVYVFDRNNSFIAVGDATVNNLVTIYGNGSTASTAITNPSGSNTLTDIEFIDDILGYVVGDDGKIFKSTNFAMNTSLDYTTGNWTQVPTGNLQDNLIPGQNTASSMEINCIAVINSSTYTIGGFYGSSNYYYRNITDEINQYSTKFWYDKLGRIVVSQNARQYNTNPKKYSYTLYDGLGRVIEAGEKTENTSTTFFKNIFGSVVSNHYNPKTIDDTKLTNWIKDTTGLRSEVTRSYYDKQETQIIPNLPTGFTQDNLRKRISAVAYYHTYNSSTNKGAYAQATHYSYDIHGNVKTLLQDNPELVSTITYAGPAVHSTNRFKRVDYTYDLISGNVHQVSYQDGKQDQWHHRYSYDGDNRIVAVETSPDKIIWSKDAKYFYYAHGPLSRVELGHNKVQGVDFAYTLQGWIKGVNSNTLETARDMGRDGHTMAGNKNELFAKDVMGYSLTYYTNDYTPIDANRWSTVTNRFEMDKTGSQLLNARNNLYNGNIGAMVTAITNPTTNAVLVNGMAYKYDQLNRLLEAQGYNNYNATTNTWNTGTVYNNRYNNVFTYDANGNILTQKRHLENGTQIEDLTYRYNEASPGKIVQNRLYHVDDNIASGVNTDDIDDMGTFTGGATINTANKYSYDAEGRLTKDLQEEIATIAWRVDGKVKSVTRTNGSTKSNMVFDYDPMGNRIAKHVLSSANVWQKSTYYVRDAQGNVLSTYEKTGISNPLYEQAEKHIYGSSRVGMDTKRKDVYICGDVSTQVYIQENGLKQYELANHLGNVLAVVTDRKIPLDANSNNVVDGYRATILSSTDYSAFGVALDGREFTSEKYRYGFNTQEKVDEIAGKGNHTTALFWEYDTRLGRRWNLDPVPQISISDYACLGNTPIIASDPLGDDVKYETKQDKKNVRREKRRNKEFREKFKVWKKSSETYTFRMRDRNPLLKDANPHYEIPLSGAFIDYSPPTGNVEKNGLDLTFGIPSTIPEPKQRRFQMYWQNWTITKYKRPYTKSSFKQGEKNVYSKEFTLSENSEIHFATFNIPDHLQIFGNDGSLVDETSQEVHGSEHLSNDFTEFSETHPNHIATGEKAAIFKINAAGVYLFVVNATGQPTNNKGVEAKTDFYFWVSGQNVKTRTFRIPRFRPREPKNIVKGYKQ